MYDSCVGAHLKYFVKWSNYNMYCKMSEKNISNYKLMQKFSAIIRNKFKCN